MELEDKPFLNHNYALVPVGFCQRCVLKNCKIRPPLFDVSSYILLEMNLASHLAAAAAELLPFCSPFGSLLLFKAPPTLRCRLLMLLGARLGSHSR